jgi:hypothetical protein
MEQYTGDGRAAIAMKEVGGGGGGGSRVKQGDIY